jgi:hypothetical protein
MESGAAAGGGGAPKGRRVRKGVRDYIGARVRCGGHAAARRAVIPAKAGIQP